MSRLAVLLGFAAVVCGACGGEDEGSPADGPTEGTLTISVQGVTGASGKTAVFFVTDSRGGAFLGTVCAPMSADPGSILVVVRENSGTNPCDVGAERLFDNGSYTVHGGLYTPGSQTAERCSTATVTVAGDTAVTMPAFGACN